MSSSHSTLVSKKFANCWTSLLISQLSTNSTQSMMWVLAIHEAYIIWIIQTYRTYTIHYSFAIPLYTFSNIYLFIYFQASDPIPETSDPIPEASDPVPEVTSDNVSLLNSFHHEQNIHWHVCYLISWTVRVLFTTELSYSFTVILFKFIFQGQFGSGLPSNEPMASSSRDAADNVSLCMKLLYIVKFVQ